MCGIAGIFGKNNKPAEEELRVMANSISHRGPDGEGFWMHDLLPVAFAHRRLSIIDLSEYGKQPMHRGDRFTIVYNGEIYNYLELRRELEKEGAQFETATDTEVLLALFERHGRDALHKLDGMFAFAIWDDLEKQLFLARDRFGEKPLYYSFINGGFYFASEMKALFAAGASRAFSPGRVYDYLQHNEYVSGKDPGSTFYRDIRQLDAASFMTVRACEIRELVRYWKPDDIPVRQEVTVEEASSAFRELLTESIRMRLRSDVPMGACISGGIDSSSIVYLLKAAGGEPLVKNSFSARFSRYEKDEGRYIGKVLSDHPGIRPHFTWPDADKLKADLTDLAFAQEEPFYSGSIYNQYSVMRLAAEAGITVLLEGQGADEQLGGYHHHYQHHLTYLFLHRFRGYLKERKGYDKIQGAIIPYHVPRRLPFWYLKKLVKGSKFVYDEPVRNLLLEESTRTGLKSLLRYGDRNSMFFGRELRLPFLSHKLSEFIFSLPIEYILHRGWSKFVLRKAVEGLVPDDITWRKDKVGFEPPQEKWLEQLGKLIHPFRAATDYRDFTDGKKVDAVGDWKWLMIMLFFSGSSDLSRKRTLVNI